MLSMNDLKIGTTITEQGDPCIVIAADHLKKSKMAPVMRTKIRNLRTGRVLHKTYKQGDSIEEAHVVKMPVQFLYAEGDLYTFMNEETYEQYELTAEKIGDGRVFLREGMGVDILLFNDAPVAVGLPVKVDLLVEHAAPDVKGNSASNVMKEIVLQGGIKMQAPLFVKAGDTVRVDTRTGAYVERV